MKIRYCILIIAFPLLLIACGGADVVAPISETAEQPSASVIESQEGEATVGESAPADDAPETAVQDDGTMEMAEQPDSGMEVAAPAAAVPADAGEMYQPGQIVTHENGLLYTVLGWKRLEPREYSPPDAGHMFIGVDVAVLNASSEPAIVATGRYMTLDIDGQSYELNYTADSLVDGSIDGRLVVGEAARGYVTYQVPENTNSMTFVYEDAFSFALGGEGAVAPPENLITSQVPLVALGQTSDLGHFQFTIHGTSRTREGDIAPKDGYEYLIIEMTVTNIGDQERTFSSVVQASLQDGAGMRIGTDVYAVLADADATLMPGETTTGAIGFHVPIGEENLMLIIDNDVRERKIFVEI